MGFAESRGYVMLDQFTSGDIDVFYGNWISARAPKAATWYAAGIFPFLHKPKMAHRMAGPTRSRPVFRRE